MEFKACLAVALLAAATLAVHAQPTGVNARSPAAALRATGDNARARQIFDFVIQKAEVRELNDAHLFSPPPPRPSYGPPPSPRHELPPQQPPRPERLSAPLSPATESPRTPSPPSSSEKLQKKQPSAKSKPTSKEREEDTRRLILGLSTPITNVQGNPRLVELQRPYNHFGQSGQLATFQLPPYFPIATYASYAVPNYYLQQAQMLGRNKVVPHFVDSVSNSIGPTDDSKQGEIPSLLGLDESRREADSRRVPVAERSNRRGKSMNNNTPITEEGSAPKTQNDGETSVHGSSSHRESSQMENPGKEKTANAGTGYNTQNSGYVYPKPQVRAQLDTREETANPREAPNSEGGSISEDSGYAYPSPETKLRVTDAKLAAAAMVNAAAEEEAEEAAEEAAVAAEVDAAAAVDAAKVAIADAAARAAAGEVAPPGVAAAPGARLVTQVALRRRGGVAIAGPGGTAAAGAGGVAVVGPGGVAFARPNALSVVGPGGRVVALPADAPEPRAGEALPAGARVVAVGPTVYLHPADAAAPPLPPLSFYKSPGWALFAAPPPPPPPLPALANLFTIINGRQVAPPVYLNAFHHNLLAMRPRLPKPQETAKSSALSPVKILQPAQIPLTLQSLTGTGFAEPYSFPTNRPPPAVEGSEAPATAPPPSTAPTPPPPPPSTTAPEPSEAPATEGSSPPPKPPPPAGGKPTVLILKPFAKAVAGINGTAVATPVGHAVYHKGQPVDVLFDPRAVAVAGPGGNARAHADLIVSYIEKEPEHRGQLTELNYFGAARGRRPVLAWQLRQEEQEEGEDNQQGGGGGGGAGGGGGGAGGGGGGAGGGAGGGGGSADSVVVNEPPPGASVAEARPVGLSIAGAGGVAASKPQATAVVGPGGLAVARPVATAIAGVPPGALLGGGPGAAQQYGGGGPAAAVAGAARRQAVAVGPGLAGPKYSVLPAGAVASLGAPAAAPADSLVYVPVYYV